MTKDDVIRRIRQLSAAGKSHVGYRTFLAETGVKDRWLRTQDWYSGWNSLLAEIGLTTQQFRTTRTPPEYIAKAVAALIARNGRWPTDDDIRKERKRDLTFPSESGVTAQRRSGKLARLLVELGSADEQYAEVAAIAKRHAKAPEPLSADGPDERVKGYVYLLRSGRSYKIGKSNDPSRRYREVRLELPEETHQVHTISTDDPAGIEAYWHQRFAARRIRNTEFFNLVGEDVRAFKRRKYQ